MDAQTILARVGETLSVRRAFGEPFERAGVVVIPVAFVAGGGGGGEGPITPTVAASQSATDSESADPPAVDPTPATGSGGGVGGVVIPLGVYVVKGDDVSWKPVIQPMLVVLPVLGLLRLLVKLRSRTLSSRK